MRKKLSIIFLLLTLTALAATACSGVKDNGFPDYDFTNPEPKEIVYDTDEGVTLDGRQDEDFWKSEHTTIRPSSATAVRVRIQSSQGT